MTKLLSVNTLICCHVTHSIFRLNFVTYDQSLNVSTSTIVSELYKETPEKCLILTFLFSCVQLSPLKPDAHRWEKEFWEDCFACDLTYRGQDYQSVNPDYPESHGDVCSGRELIDNVTFSGNPYVINTINAVYTYAVGLAK